MTFLLSNQLNNQAPSPTSEPSAVPVLTLTSQLQFHHQEDKLRSQGISRALQITLFIAFLAVNVPEQSASGRQDADWLTVSGNTDSTFYTRKVTLVAQHFNSPGHSLEDVRVAVLKSGLARKDVRQREEMRQMFNFQTLAPRGINRDFSFI